ncbi:MAG: glutathione synthase/RimK-type ligase-like ATP-grasp enzyme [Myxococcota bacterium]|jgi:glutathione synthase/RimK-type ligase-like ATP-grasp enzyme
MIAIGVLVPTQPGALPPPDTRPVGRAALNLREEGILAVFGDTIHRESDGTVWMSGHTAAPEKWEPARLPIQALHDRFPSQRRAARYAEVRAVVGDLPLGNPPALTLLCRDKADCQRYLEARAVPMPALRVDPASWDGALSSWGSGFLKPRYGALGVGVRRVVPGDVLPEVLEGVVPGRSEPAILQQAVSPPVGWAGRSVRALCQRLPGGGWHFCPPAVRQSRDDYVINVSRGAEVRPATDVLSAETRAHIAAACQATCAALSAHAAGRWLVELGLDLMIDGNGLAHVIEVNSRPRGRLEALAEADPSRFAAAHREACARPLRYLAATAAQ